MSIRDEVVEASAGQQPPYQVGAEMEPALRRLLEYVYFICLRHCKLFGADNNILTGRLLEYTTWWSKSPTDHSSSDT